MLMIHVCCVFVCNAPLRLKSYKLIYFQRHNYWKKLEGQNIRMHCVNTLGWKIDFIHEIFPLSMKNVLFILKWPRYFRELSCIFKEESIRCSFSNLYLINNFMSESGGTIWFYALFSKISAYKTCMHKSVSHTHYSLVCCHTKMSS